MSELMFQGNYLDYKKTLDAELQKSAESFVRIGYLLKVARDTSILAESGYKSVTEFAQAEYGIDKSQVSRFIRINDKFAEGGYSEQLQEQYQGFGFSKLSLMLQLPDSVNEELTPDFTKAQIGELKEAVQQAQEDSPLEIYAEQLQEQEEGREEDILTKAVRELAWNSCSMFEEIHEAGEGANPMDWLLHEDVAQYSVRILGQGRMSLILKKDGISLVNLRTDEKWAFTEEDMKQAWKNIGVWEPDAMEKFFPDEPEEPEETPKPKPVDLSKINNVEELRNAGTTGAKPDSGKPEKPQKTVPEVRKINTEDENDTKKEPEMAAGDVEELSVDRRSEASEGRGPKQEELEYYETKIRLLKTALDERQWSKLKHFAQDIARWAERMEDDELDGSM